MNLPQVFLDNQEPVRSDEHCTVVDGMSYRLTKHGRARYLERVDPGATDADILRNCIRDPRAVWRPDRVNEFRLVTYLSSRRRAREVNEQFEEYEEDWYDILYEELH